MSTLSGVWSRLKPPLEAAKKSGVAKDSKLDPKKAVQAIDHFIAQFTPVMTQFDALFKKRSELNATFRKAAEQAITIVQPMMVQLDAAHKDGFDTDNSAYSNLHDRMSEMVDRLKDLKNDGAGVQWD